MQDAWLECSCNMSNFVKGCIKREGQLEESACDVFLTKMHQIPVAVSGRGNRCVWQYNKPAARY